MSQRPTPKIASFEDYRRSARPAREHTHDNRLAPRELGALLQIAAFTLDDAEEEIARMRRLALSATGEHHPAHGELEKAIAAVIAKQTELETAIAGLRKALEAVHAVLEPAVSRPRITRREAANAAVRRVKGQILGRPDNALRAQGLDQPDA